MKQNNLIIILIIAVFVGGIGFYAGTQYQKNNSGQQFGNRQFGQRNNGQNANARGIRGEVVDIDDQGITVKLSDGSTKIVFVSDKTSINKAAQAAKADLKTGEEVLVFGQQNADGSVTAQNIQLNPQLRGLMSTPSASTK